MNESPYLIREIVQVVREYNPKYGDDKLCQCGHAYYRHFDSYEEMSDVGCKYCFCVDFDPAGEYVCICHYYKMRDDYGIDYIPTGGPKK
jgi:hypothetical protein